MLALDLLSLRDADGSALEPGGWRERVAQTLTHSQCVAVWRDARLVAYALLQPRPEFGDAGDWFVSGFNLHPAHRDVAVWRQLSAQLRELTQAQGIRRLHSHVYKHNRASLALHRRLGFDTVNENAQALAFRAEVSALRWPGRTR